LPFDDAEREAVLHGAERVERLELDEQLDAVERQVVDAHDRRVADRVEDRAADAGHAVSPAARVAEVEGSAGGPRRRAS
jgi:hypothetical protein